MNEGISIGSGILWVIIWFGFMLLYTAFDIKVWRRIASPWGKYLNPAFVLLCIIAYLALLARANHFEIDLFGNVSLWGMLSAAGCAVLFYFILDKGLDPLFEKFFPQSEENYQRSLKSLGSSPVAGFLQACVLAPFIEEILMRGFLLDGLSKSFGEAIALLVSAFLFALLHFNMVQTLSAFICGIILGLLYLYTGSLFCCISAHAGYNTISYITAVLLPRNKH